MRRYVRYVYVPNIAVRPNSEVLRVHLLQPDVYFRRQYALVAEPGEGDVEASEAGE